MNKKTIILLMVLFNCVFLYAQEANNIISYLSIQNQYNTLTDAQGNFEWDIPNPNKQHYFFGFPEYSNAILSESEYSGYKDNRRTTLTQWTLRLAAKNGNQLITFGGGYPENINSIEDTKIVYSITNGRLSYWEWYGNRLIDIRYIRNNEINILSANSSDGTMPTHLHCYINIPQDELFEMYIKLFLEGIDYILDRKWETRIKYHWLNERLFEKRYDNENIIRESLNGLTIRELAIFRNYIFARHNYRFRSEEWNTFFRTSYKNDYNGIRTSDEIMNIMTLHEKNILQLIIEQERR